MELPQIIIQKIKDQGPISFQSFMEMCLYYPDLGYYTSWRHHIGKQGDYYTSSNLTSVFGAVIGKQLEQMWCLLNKNPFTIIEYGAGTGSMCHDILNYLKNNKEMYDQLQYGIIEKSGVMRQVEQRHLKEKISWYDSIEEISGIHGCILSNELIDNFSVHQVIMQKELMEVFVDYQDGFIETLRPAQVELKNYFYELGVTLPEGFRTEINLQAIDWIKNVAKAINKGYVMTIDYGYLSSELYQQSRRQGTLRCYYHHAVNDFIYTHLGEQDISAHVNFSALIHWGAKNGLRDCGFTDQCRFLLSLGFQKHLELSLATEDNMAKAAEKAAHISHTLLIDMGAKFKVLIQQKGPCGKKLLGLLLSDQDPSIRPSK